MLGKPSILVPSPNVAEDHQTHNAMSLVRHDAAIMVRDADAPEQLLPLALRTATDINRLKTLSANALTLGKPDAAEVIAREVIGLVRG
jgi:UDP-N-acetylglucosamine--N-acetylmuramyl-(pentapeptide) pyrophosphoryl-undecaprenol N-acetylglucosamine transferase